MAGRSTRAIALGAVAIALAAVGFFAIPPLRRTYIRAAVTYDAEPGPAVALPAPPAGAAGLARVDRTRVILIDGLDRATARTLPAWSATCARGTRLAVDVGFPTVSLAVEAALWSGRAQGTSGIVFRNDNPIVPPLAGVPSSVPGSIAIAESHGYIVRSLGFTTALPAADPAHPAKDLEPAAWEATWRARAVDAVRSPANLVFVHVLRVDVAGHAHGGASPEYAAAARDADAIVAELTAAAPDARWFLLSDHAHLPTGGHGGEERAIRQVDACLAGPGVAVAAPPGLVHLLDVTRALADSTGVDLPGMPGRPLAGAIAAPIGDDDALPAIPTHRLALALAMLAGGLALTIAFARGGVALYPWWWLGALAALVVVRAPPTLSMPMVYQRTGATMTYAWLPALALGALLAIVAFARRPAYRVIVAALALPIAAAAAALTASGGWGALLGEEVAPIAPYVTAWTSPLILLVGHGLLAVALAALATLVRRAFDRPAPPAAPRTPP